MDIKTRSRQKEEIKLLLRYGAPLEYQEEALTLLDKHESDSIALNVFHHFYSFLPEAEDDSIRLLRQLAHRKGAFLICATTYISDYIYLVTNNEAEFLGKHEEGIWDKEVLSFFGFKDRNAFLKTCGILSSFPVYVPAYLNVDLCPVCHVAGGEHHTMGCPLEICPWCGGQLTGCNCRFQQMEQNKLDKESQLDTFQEKLIAKGRIPFDAQTQRPAYPAEAHGSDSDNRKA